MTPTAETNLTRALAAWGVEAPAWVLELARQCDAASGARVASRLGYSPAVVSNVLRNTYKGALSRVEDRVRGRWMAATVVCPVVGDLGLDVCAENQSRPFANTNQTRTRLWKACRAGCPHSKIGGKTHG